MGIAHFYPGSEQIALSSYTRGSSACWGTSRDESILWPPIKVVSTTLACIRPSSTPAAGGSSAEGRPPFPFLRFYLSKEPAPGCSRARVPYNAPGPAQIHFLAGAVVNFSGTNHLDCTWFVRKLSIAPASRKGCRLALALS